MTARTKRLIVSEVFGPTLQGEGPTSGRRCGFVRLGLCNLRCAWCDTPYTWDWTGLNGQAWSKDDLDRLGLDDIIDQLEPMSVERVVVSGGEPLVQNTGHMLLVLRLLAEGYNVETETNGTLLPHESLHALGDECRWNVSPKLAHAGNDMTDAERIKFDVLEWFSTRPTTSFKFVIGSPLDVDEVVELCERIGIAPGQVWLMPQGITRDELEERSRFVFDAAIDNGYNASTRTHVLAWGNERAR